MSLSLIYRILNFDEILLRNNTDKQLCLFNTCNRITLDVCTGKIISKINLRSVAITSKYFFVFLLCFKYITEKFEAKLEYMTFYCCTFYCYFFFLSSRSSSKCFTLNKWRKSKQKIKMSMSREKFELGNIFSFS